MPYYSLTFSGSPLVKLAINADIYATGYITLEFAQDSNINLRELAEEFVIAQTRIDKNSNGDELVIFDYAHYQFVFDYLNSKGWLILQDSTIVQFIQYCAFNLAKRKNIVDFAQLGHEEALTSLSDDYIEEILNNIEDPQLAIMLLSSSFSTELYEGPATLTEDIISSVDALRKINFGCAQLEDHFHRISDKLPSLKIQRNIIRDYIAQKVLIKFSNASDEILLCSIIILTASTSRYKLRNNRNDIFALIKNVLREGELSYSANDIVNDTANIFRDKLGRIDIDTVLTEALITMGFFKKDSTDLPRLAALQAVLCSPNIAKYIEACSDALYQALQAKNTHKIAEEIKKRAIYLFHPYLFGGKKPLMVAIENQDYPCVQMLFAAGACVNDGRHSYNPITSAINFFHIDILGHVFSEPNAHLFSICSTIHYFSDNGTACKTEETPFSLGVQKFLYAPYRQTNQTMMRFLLETGLGLGFKFSPEFTPLLDGMVIIGATWHPQPTIHPISTVSEFQQRISPQKYEYWQRIFKEALSEPVLSSNTDLCSQLTTLNSWMSNKTLMTAPDSPITKMGAHYHYALKQIESVIKISENNELNSILASINQRAFGKALRQACSTEDPNGYIIANILLNYNDVFPLDINEKGQIKPLAAIHYAAQRRDKALYELLIKHKANYNLKNEYGNTAAEMMHQFAHTH